MRIVNGKIPLNKTDKDETSLLGKTFSFRNKAKPINPARNDVKRFKTPKI